MGQSISLRWLALYGRLSRTPLPCDAPFRTRRHAHLGCDGARLRGRIPARKREALMTSDIDTGATAPPYQPDDYLALLGEAQAVLSPAEYAVFKVEMLGVLRYKLYEFSPPLDHRFAIALPPESLDRLQVRIHACDRPATSTAPAWRSLPTARGQWAMPNGCGRSGRGARCGDGVLREVREPGTPTPEQRDFRQQVYHLGWAGTDEAAAMLAAQLDRLLQPAHP